MTALLLAPHNDDETLFASYLLMQHRAHVIVCLRSTVQEARGIDALTREEETASALGELGGGIGAIPWEQWAFGDDLADPEVRERMTEALRRVAALQASVEPEAANDPVFAPAVEDGGHEGHNLVGEVATAVFGDRVIQYLTYRRGHGKSVGMEVVPEPWMIERKLRALACYRSQIEEPSTRPWFVGDLREYVA